MYSEYGKPLLGDLVVEFSQDRQISEFPLWTLPILLIGVLFAILFYKRNRLAKLSKCSLTINWASVDYGLPAGLDGLCT